MGDRRLGLILITSFAVMLVLPLATFAGLSVAPLPYTGIVKNCTAYNISIPSENSSATLIVPAYSSIEYTAWSPSFLLTGFLRGKQIYCQKIKVKHNSYTVNCQKYDFMAEITYCEPVPKAKKVYKKRKTKKRRSKPVG